MRALILYSLIIIWFIASSAAIFVFGNQGLQYFDPKLKLSANIMALDFEKRLVASLPLTSGAQIFHIIDPKCACSFVNNFHRSALNRWAEKNQVAQLQIELSDYPELAAFVPSTPAIAVIDEQKHLVYFGPYSEGQGCLQNESLVDSVIKPVFESDEPYRSQIRSEAFGCYCEAPNIYFGSHDSTNVV